MFFYINKSITYSIYLVNTIGIIIDSPSQINGIRQKKQGKRRKKLNHSHKYQIFQNTISPKLPYILNRNNFHLHIDSISFMTNHSCHSVRVLFSFSFTFYSSILCSLVLMSCNVSACWSSIFHFGFVYFAKGSYYNLLLAGVFGAIATNCYLASAAAVGVVVARLFAYCFQFSGVRLLLCMGMPCSGTKEIKRNNCWNVH